MPTANMPTFFYYIHPHAHAGIYIVYKKVGLVGRLADDTIATSFAWGCHHTLRADGRLWHIPKYELCLYRAYFKMSDTSA